MIYGIIALEFKESSMVVAERRDTVRPDPLSRHDCTAAHPEHERSSFLDPRRNEALHIMAVRSTSIFRSLGIVYWLIGNRPDQPADGPA